MADDYTYDQSTGNLRLPLPHPGNKLRVDVLRLREAISQIDANIANRALENHTHTAPTKAAVGLDKVNNTADADKPISAPTQTALDAKADKASIGPLAGPSSITLNRAAGGALHSVVQVIGGQNATTTLTRSADGTLASVATTCAGRTRTETLHRAASGDLLSVTTVIAED